MHDATCQQGRHCQSCHRATIAAYLGIWLWLRDGVKWAAGVFKRGVI